MVEISTIYLDMDGVLANFDLGACDAHGLSLDAVNRFRRRGEWLLLRRFGALTGRDRDMTMEEFWEPINERGEHFWLWLKEEQYARAVIDVVLNGTIPWHVVTAPSLHPGCYSGKVKWIREFLGQPKFNQIIPTPFKSLLARPGALLIDDNEGNVNGFQEAGGASILYPTPWNRNHPFASDPVGYLKQQLKEIIDGDQGTRRQRGVHDRDEGRPRGIDLRGA